MVVLGPCGLVDLLDVVEAEAAAEASKAHDMACCSLSLSLHKYVFVPLSALWSSECQQGYANWVPDLAKAPNANV